MEDIKADTVVLRGEGGLTNGKGNGGEKDSGKGKDANGSGNGKGRGEGGQSLALPKNVVEEGVRITRECLDLVCEVVE